MEDNIDKNLEKNLFSQHEDKELKLKSFSSQILGKFSFIWSSLYKTYNLESEKILQMKISLDNDLVDKALGSMFGAFIGDSLGSYCQFKSQPYMLDDPELDLVMQMPGKGTFNIKPGQFTDDSQMASHMLEALGSYNPNVPFQQQKTKLILKIASQYVNWYNSNPFDMGKTTRIALKLLKVNLQQMKLDSEKGISVDQQRKLRFILTKIQIKNESSLSNGSLMRITPMAFFISFLLENQRKKDPDVQCIDFKSFIKSEINLTHGNPQILESSYAWVELLVSIIERKRSNKDLEQIYDEFISRYSKNEIIGHWIKESLKLKDMDGIAQKAKAISCFSYGIKALKTLIQIEEDYLDPEHYVIIIKKIITKAGDSDTNAAIVGGLVGAVLGFKRLPLNYLFKQFKLELNQSDIQCQKRGAFYEPKRQFYKAMNLIDKFEFFNKLTN